MRIRVIAVLGLSIVCLAVAGCSSSAEAPSKKVAATSNSNVGGDNSASITNGMQVPPPQVVDPNSVPAGAANNVGLAREQTDQRIQNLRKSGGSGAMMTVEEIAEKNSRPAPDNSTFTSYLTDAGYEIRTFRDHPQLVKVEKRIAADGKQSIKIVLRNGKIVELPGDRIAVLSSASAAQILEAAGIQPQPPRPVTGAPLKKSGE